ncbi:hypothetical protein HDV05_001849, partial [Chytridiales sp. JEL 0842]
MEPLKDSEHPFLTELNFTYDNSITYSPARIGGLWPFTFHNGVPIPCNTGTCDSTSRFPGLWEVPMNVLADAQGATYSSMDPSGTPEFLLNMLKDNFLKYHYNSRRAPFGVWLHAAWLMIDPGRLGVLNTFLKWAREVGGDDVWFVTPGQLVEWMKNPVHVDQMASHPAFQCKRGPTVVTGREAKCDGLDDNGDGQIDEGLKKRCTVESYWFETCFLCPTGEPVEGRPLVFPGLV